MFLLELFNSSLMSFYIQKAIFSETTESARHLDYPYLSLLPIIRKKEKDKDIKKIKENVKLMLKLVEDKFNREYSGNEKERLEQQIKNVDYEIDQEVYKLYGLTKEEIKIVEESLN